MRPSIARLCRTLALVLAAALPLIAPGFTGEARAQGTSSLLPDPITTADLLVYMDRVGLSRQQEMAVEQLHDQYRSDFRQLREGEIERLMSQMRDLQGARTGMPPKEDLEAFVEGMERVSVLIRDVDERFFAQVQVLLDADQQRRLARVRLARERDRLAGQEQFAMMLGGRPADLVEVTESIELSAAARERIDPILAGYESELTTLYREFSKASTRMYLDMFDALEDIGYSEEALQDPEQATELMRQMQEIFMEITTNLRRQGVEMRELNQRTIDRLAAVLDPVPREALHAAYYPRDYQSVAVAWQQGTPTYLDALRLEELTEEQTERLEAFDAAFRSERDRLVRAVVEATDDQVLQGTVFFGGNGGSEELGDRLGELGSWIQEQRPIIAERLQEILSPEQFRQTQMLVAERPQPDRPRDPLEAAGLTTLRSLEPLVQQGVDAFLPPAVSASIVHRLADWLELGDDDRLVIGEIHDGYREAYAEAEAGVRRRLRELRTGIYSDPARIEQEDLPTGEAAVAAMLEVRRTARERFDALDAELFGDLAVALEGEDAMALVEMLRRSRRSEVVNRGQQQWGTRSRDPEIDLADLAAGMRMPLEVRADLALALRGYQERLEGLMADRYQARMATDEARERWSARMIAQQREGADQAELAAQGILEYQARVREPQERERALTRQVIDLNRATMALLARTIGSDRAAEFQRRYRELAFPTVHDDPLAADDYLDTALGFGDLTPGQRDELRELRAGYEPRYDELSRAMEEICRQELGIGEGGTPEQWQEFSRLNDALTRSAFERRELSSRTLRRLRQILSPEQVERLGELPTIGG